MSQLAALIDRNLEICSTVEFGEIAFGLDEMDAIDLIKTIDLAQGDGDFTWKLIKELFKSLRGDYAQDEGKELIKELKKLNKSIA